MVQAGDDYDATTAAFCGVAKVSPSLLQHLGCQCWDVVQISQCSNSTMRTSSRHAHDDGDNADDNDNGMLTSCILQVIPDDKLCVSNNQVVAIHPLLWDFLQVAAEEEELASVANNNNISAGTDATRTAVVETKDDIAESALSPQSTSIAVELVSFGPQDDYDEIDASSQKQQQQQHLQWFVRKQPLVSSSSTVSSSSHRNSTNSAHHQQLLHGGSSLVVHCVYSDAPIIRVQNDNDEDSVLDDNPQNYDHFTQDDLAAALEDRLVQKGCTMLLAVSSSSSSSVTKRQAQNHRHRPAKNEGKDYVIALLQDICLPAMSNSTESTIENNDGEADERKKNHHYCSDSRDKVYRLGTRDSFRLSVTSTPSVVSMSSSAAGHRPVVDRDDDDSSSCPGYESLQQQLVQLLDPAYLKSSSFCRPSGVLLTGSIGVGKTRLSLCVARQLSLEKHCCKVHYISLQDLHLQATVSGGGTSASTTLDDLMAALLPPFTNVLIVDDLHVLASEDGGTTEQEQQGSFPDMERQLIQSALLQVIDACVEQGIPCLGIGSTEWNLLPAMLIKFGRLEKQLEMPSPTQHQREVILQHNLGEMMNMSSEQAVRKARQWASILAPLTAGCVAADLCRLCHNAQMRSWARQQQQQEEHHDSFAVSSHGESSDMSFGLALPPQPPPTWDDLREAAQELVPLQLATLDVIKPTPPRLVFDDASSSSDGNTSFLPRRSKDDDWLVIHEQSWSRLAGYAAVKKRVFRTVVAPWRRFLKYENQEYSGGQGSFEDEPKAIASKLLIPPPTGIIFHGVSGCGKTLAAFCLGASLEWSMIHVHTATDVLDQWLGGSEAALRSLFARARAAAPCILFLDEIDAIVCNRNKDNDGDSTNVMTRLLSTLLNEMDGIAGSSSSPTKVLVVACTNQPLDSLDAALLRPGRLDHHVELKTPVTLDDAVAILQVYVTRKNTSSQTAAADSILHRDVDLKVVAHRALEESKKLGAVTGADLEGLAREAILCALRRNLEESSTEQESSDTDASTNAVQVTMKDFNDAFERI